LVGAPGIGAWPGLNPGVERPEPFAPRKTNPRAGDFLSPEFDDECMTTTDYLINFALIALVILQIRGSRCDLKTALRPLILVGAAAVYYLRGIPTAGHDLQLDGVLIGVGLILGIACGATTRVWRASDGFAYAKAGVAAAVLWIVGLGGRLAFEEYWSHGGTKAIVNFSVAHHITSQDAWVAALVLMALAEVASRLVTIRIRAARTNQTGEALGAGRRTQQASAA
jgi:hypothetical protein